MASGNCSHENCVFGIYCTDGRVKVGGNVNVVCSTPQNELPFKDFPLPKLISTFHGRDQEFDELDSLFFVKNNKKTVLCGLPGYGKTELSKQFAQRCLETNKVKIVMWIKAEVQEDLEDLYPKLSKIYRECNENCLLIFDNGVCRRDIFDYEPPEKDNFFVLITSQEKDWGDDVTPLQLDTLSEESSIEVLKLILGNKYDEENLTLYKQLTEFIDNVPLGLQVLGGFIRQQIKDEESKFDLKEYLQKLKQSQEEIIDETISKNIPNSYEKSIYAAMSVSLHKIKEEINTEIKELSFNVLFICAYLNPDKINFHELVRISSVKDYILTFDKKQNQLEFSIALLENYSFINVNINIFDNTEYNGLKIHRLTQRFVQYYLNKCKQHSIYYKSCVCYITCDEPYSFSSIHMKSVLSIANNNINIIFDIYEESKQNVKDKFLTMLVQFGCINCLEIIFDRSKRDFTIKYSLLNLSVRCNKKDVFKFLLKYIKLDTNARIMNYKHMLLYSAAVRNHVEFFEMLITEYGLELNQSDRRSRTALHGLLYDYRKRKYRSSKLPNVKRMIPIFKLAIKYGAKLKKIKVMSECEETISFILKYVIQFNEIEVLEWFLENNIDANYIISPKKGVIILHRAAVSGNVEAIRLIVSFHPDVCKTDIFGNTALFRFVKNGSCIDIDMDTVNNILDLLKCENHEGITNKSGENLLDCVTNEDWKPLILQKYELGKNKQNL